MASAGTTLMQRLTLRCVYELAVKNLSQRESGALLKPHFVTFFSFIKCILYCFRESGRPCGLWGENPAWKFRIQSLSIAGC